MIEERAGAKSVFDFDDPSSVVTLNYASPWLCQTVFAGNLSKFLKLPLLPVEQNTVEVEEWFFGVM